MFPLLVLALAQPADPFAKWEKEIARIEKRLAEPVFFVGSSSIRLWDVQKSFPGVAAVNVGFGGSQIPDSTHFAPRIILPFKPKAIVFYAGDNDIAAGRTPNQLAADFRAFAAEIHQHLPKTRILFIAVKPSVARWKLYDKQVEANALIKGQCDKDDRLAYVDIVPAMLGPDGKPAPDLFAKDGLHLSPKGYEIWTAAVKKALE